jgi:ankyrin repeat protein
MGAIFKAEVSIAKTLITADCQPDQPNHNGQTAAMYAALFGRDELLKALAARGANLDQADLLGNTARKISQGELRTR